MALNSKSIADLISKPKHNPGAVMYMGRRNGMGADQLTRSQRQFVDDYLQVKAPEQKSTAHPAAGPVKIRQPGPLSPSELAWLARIPSPVDPTAVSFEDARTLAAMASSVNRIKHADDARLIESVWHPVLEFHDQRSADAAVENARQPLAPLPSSTLGALADAILAENGQLTYDEAVGRAGKILSDASATREAARQAAIDDAQQQRMQVDARVVSRTTVTP